MKEAIYDTLVIWLELIGVSILGISWVFGFIANVFEQVGEWMIDKALNFKY